MNVPKFFLVLLSAFFLSIGFIQSAAAEAVDGALSKGMAQVIVYNKSFTGGRELSDPRVKLFVNDKEEFVLNHGEAKSVIVKPGKIIIKVKNFSRSDHGLELLGRTTVKAEPDETYYIELGVDGGSILEAGGFSLRQRAVKHFNEMVARFPEAGAKKNSGSVAAESSAQLDAKIRQLEIEYARKLADAEKAAAEKRVATKEETERLEREALAATKLETERMIQEAMAVAAAKAEKLIEEKLRESRLAAEQETAAQREARRVAAQKRAEENNQNGIAVVIGNKGYSQRNKDVPDVDFAHNDADAIHAYLRDKLGYQEGNIILLKDASQGDMSSIFGNERSHRGKLFNWTKAGKSKVFVYYSGHGAPALSDGSGYLLPVDSDPMTVELNGYPLETLYANLAKIPAKSITVVLDACFSGSSANGNLVKSASSIALRRIETKSKLSNGTVLSAADVSEVASWDNERKMGLFTAYFLDGVQGAADQGEFGDGDGKVRLGELKKYVSAKVNYMARRKYYREQNPQVSGDEELVLSTLD